MEKERDYTINAVKKAIDLLNVFDNQNQGLTLVQLSNMTGIGKSTLFRFLYTLRNADFIDFDEETKKYSLGMALYRLGQIKYDSLDIRSSARKHLQRLCDEAGLICYLGVRHGDMIVMLERVFPYNVPTWTQYLIPDDNRELYSTGIGRLFLAHCSEEELNKYFDRVNIKKFTDCTITDKETLLELIYQARKEGYSGNIGENEHYICSLCAPVYNLKGNIIAGISICGPQDMLMGEEYDKYLGKIKETALAISQDMGYGDKPNI